MSTLAKNHEVRISHINDPYDFYVRLETCSKVFEDLQSILHESHHEEQCDTDIIDLKNEKWLYAYRDDELSWCRVRIENQEETTCDVFYIDHGISKRVPAYRLQQIFDEFCTRVPPLALFCKLDWIVPTDEKWTEDDIHAMKQLTQGNKLEMVVIRVLKNRQSLVNLYASDCIATMLVYCGNGLLKNPQNEVNEIVVCKKLEPKVYQFVKAPQELQVFKITHYKNVNNFYVIQITSENRFENICKRLNEKFDVYERFDRAAIKKDLPVICASPRRGQSYHRGLVFDVKEGKDKVQVYFVDVGVVRDVDLHDLRRAESAVFDWPALAMKCSLDENQLTDYRATRKLHVGATLVAKITSLAKPYSFEVSLKKYKQKDVLKMI